MSLSPLPLPNLFLFSLRSPSVQNLQAEALIQIPKAIQIPFTNSKRKQTKQSTISTPAKRTKAKPKRHHNTFHPTSTTRKTHLLTPPNSPQTTVKIPETAKRKYVSSQTPKSLPPNAEAFQTKRQRVSFQTQRRFPPSYLPTLLFPESTYKNTPKPLPESSKHAQFMRQ